jgi:hypothetical protein
VYEYNNRTSGIGAFDINTPNLWEPAYPTDTVGNGLTQSLTTGVLYTACEADFIPLLGRVYAFNISAPGNQVYTYAKDLWAADGAFIAQELDLLFMSDVVSAAVRVYNVTADPLQGTPIQDYKAPGMETLDDFCTLMVDGVLWLLGADFLAQKVVAYQAWPFNSSNYFVLASGFGGNPTSVRVGRGPGWAASTGSPNIRLYISEGGPLPIDPSLKNRLTLHRSNMRAEVQSGTEHNRQVWELEVPLSIFSTL